MIDKPSTSGLQQGSDVIAHFAALESRIRARAKESHEMSLTLSDLDLSTDSEVKKDLNEIRKRRTTKLSHKSYSSSSSESEKIDFIKRDMPVKSLNSASVDDTNES
uniref:Uncharacterized protein n=1 Tax=Ciona savignyi TaxID=51511 RepID=H2YXL9_CIOSA